MTRSPIDDPETLAEWWEIRNMLKPVIMRVGSQQKWRGTKRRMKKVLREEGFDVARCRALCIIDAIDEASQGIYTLGERN